MTHHYRNIAKLVGGIDETSGRLAQQLYAAAIRHTGRRSGKQYTTPVVVERVADGVAEFFKR